LVKRFAIPYFGLHLGFPASHSGTAGRTDGPSFAHRLLRTWRQPGMTAAFFDFIAPYCQQGVQERFEGKKVVVYGFR
jgi:hypothetical protein